MKRQLVGFGVLFPKSVIDETLSQISLFTVRDHPADHMPAENIQDDTTVCNLKAKGAESWQEFGDIEYRRVFSVPQTIDVAKVNGEFIDRTLKLHLPKAEAVKPRTIEIRPE